MKKIKDRTGEEKINFQGCLMKIIHYDTNKNLTVQFQDKNGYIVYHVNYNAFKNGSIKNPFCPNICGIGYLGLTSMIDSNGKRKDSYRMWCGMLERCYKSNVTQYYSYKDCFVCEEWHCYANFEQWYNKNYYEIDDERMNLDKDILVKGNKIYSPDTCIFTPSIINCLFVKCSNNENSFLGVNYNKKYDNYYVRVNVKGKKKHVGVYNTKEEAFIAYKQFKENYIKSVADEYKDKIPKKLYDALYNWKVEK